MFDADYNQSAGNLFFDVGLSFDQLLLGGAFNVTGGGLQVTASETGTFVLMHAAGGITNAAFSSIVLPDYATLLIQGDELVLVVTPEPAAWELSVGALLAAAALRRRNSRARG